MVLQIILNLLPKRSISAKRSMHSSKQWSFCREQSTKRKTSLNSKLNLNLSKELCKRWARRFRQDHKLQCRDPELWTPAAECQDHSRSQPTVVSIDFWLQKEQRLWVLLTDLLLHQWPEELVAHSDQNLETELTLVHLQRLLKAHQDKGPADLLTLVEWRILASAKNNQKQSKHRKPNC